MTRRELIDHCLEFPLTYEDYPFDDIMDENRWAVIRHNINKKTFALIYERGGNLCINLKCDPTEASLLRQAFKGVIPGFHMNKEHWNTVIMGSDVLQVELFRQIENSYNLIKPKVKRGKR